MLFYILRDKDGSVCFSPFPALDKLHRDAQVYLKPGLPLELLARYFQDKVRDQDRSMVQDRVMVQGKIRFPGGAGFPLSETEVLRIVESGLKKDRCQVPEKARWLPVDSESPHYQDCLRLNQDEAIFAKLCKMLRGRQIAEGNYSSLATALDISPAELAILLHKAALLGFGEWLPALRRKAGSWSCQRCGQSSFEKWPSIYGDAATCLACISIGALTSLQVLFQMKDTPAQGTLALKAADSGSNNEQGKMKEVQTDSDLRLTDAQQKIADELQRAICFGPNREILIWAACGAGKTEITFPVIGDYLALGKRVLYAAPRQDVVHDIAPRLQRYFRHYTVKLLSGALKPDWEDRLLTVATTHQVLKYKRAFDLIVFDEMDAYPYAENRALAFGIQQALQDSGKMIYLSATPSEEILNKVHRQECLLLRLPARFHGWPLPRPEYVRLKLPHEFSKDWPPTPAVLSAVCQMFNVLLEKGPLFVFVPTVKLVGEWASLLSPIYRDKTVMGSWSRDPKRQEHIAAFSSGSCDLLVCTSILERGITVRAAQVAVLYADHALFDVRTLVQMAGRAGRTADCPSGRVVFMAEKRSKTIAEAIAWIDEQNKLALEGGLLRGQ